MMLINYHLHYGSFLFQVVFIIKLSRFVEVNYHVNEFALSPMSSPLTLLGINDLSVLMWH